MNKVVAIQPYIEARLNRIDHKAFLDTIHLDNGVGHGHSDDMARYFIMTHPEPRETPSNGVQWSISDELNWIEKHDPAYTHRVERIFTDRLEKER